MNTIISNNTNDKQLNFTINRFFKDNKIGSILKQCNFSKEKGLSCINIFRYIFMLVFTGKNFFRTLESKKNSVVDDSLYSRSRSKPVELLLRVRDHVAHKYVKGFSLLILGWADGNTFLLLTFTLLSSENKENRLCSENQAIDKRINGYKLRKEAILKSPAAIINLLKQASQYGIPTAYVLFDSWFTYPKTLLKILELKFHTIAMVKAIPRVYYNYNGKLLNIKGLYDDIKKRRGKEVKAN